MPENKKITEAALLELVQPGNTLLSWLRVSEVENGPENTIEIEIPSKQKKRGRKKKYRFEVRPYLESTPKAVKGHRRAALSGKINNDVNYLFIYPFLYPKSQSVLAGEGDESDVHEISWVDLSGNGSIVVPDKLYVKSLVNYNKNPQSRALANPYAGRSALVGRLLLEQAEWPSLKSLVEAVKERGAAISLPQASKAVQALEEELIVAKNGNGISLKNYPRLLNELSLAYKPVEPSRSTLLRLPNEVSWMESTAKLKNINWAVIGESSVGHYTAFAQGGAVRVAVSDLNEAMQQLGGEIESVPNFASLELIETDAPEYYFQNHIDEQGVRWASAIQTWLELQSGDARQKDAAAEIRRVELEKNLP